MLRLPVLVGATATGKTDLSLRVATAMEFPVEIVVLDSRQLYKGLDVGTGKPNATEQELVRHHLIDLLEPSETFDAARYRHAVEGLVPEILERGAVPLFVGGAGFYLRALREGFHELPEHGAEELAALRGELDSLDDEALRAELERVDPAKATALHVADRYRNQRALELFRLSGKPASELEADFEPRPVLGAEFDLLVVSEERGLLHERIEARTRRWWEEGWAEEVGALLSSGVAEDSPGLSILGYCDVVEVLAGRIEQAEAVDRTIIGTRRYARSQEVWWRKLPAQWQGRAQGAGAEEALAGALRRAAEAS